MVVGFRGYSPSWWRRHGVGTSSSYGGESLGMLVHISADQKVKELRLKVMCDNHPRSSNWTMPPKGSVVSCKHHLQVFKPVDLHV